MVNSWENFSTSQSAHGICSRLQSFQWNKCLHKISQSLHKLCSVVFYPEENGQIASINLDLRLS